jgi:phosphoglycolate phosphatase
MTSSFPKAVIFDLDGTLVDSAPDIARALNAGFEPLGIAPYTAETAKALIGGGARAAIERAISNHGLDAATIDQAALYKRFMAAYAAASAEGNGLYAGAHETLGALSEQGTPLALCTNKSHDIALIALDALNITRYFGSIVGARDGQPKKPDARALSLALSPFGVATADAIMIGDSAADIGAAKAAGCPSIAMSYGYARGGAASLGADLVIDHLAELPMAIAALSRSRR